MTARCRWMLGGGGKISQAASARACSKIHDARSGVAFHLAQELPTTGADVFLLDRAAVHGDGRRAALKGAIEDLEEVVAALLRVVDAAPHLDGHGHAGRHGLAHARNNLERRIHLA
jgi:hypothetical protein